MNELKEKTEEQSTTESYSDDYLKNSDKNLSTIFETTHNLQNRSDQEFCWKNRNRINLRILDFRSDLTFKPKELVQASLKQLYGCIDDHVKEWGIKNIQNVGGRLDFLSFCINPRKRRLFTSMVIANRINEQGCFIFMPHLTTRFRILKSVLGKYKYTQKLG